MGGESSQSLGGSHRPREGSGSWAAGGRREEGTRNCGRPRRLALCPRAGGEGFLRPSSPCPPAPCCTAATLASCARLHSEVRATEACCILPIPSAVGSRSASCIPIPSATSPTPSPPPQEEPRQEAEGVQIPIAWHVPRTDRHDRMRSAVPAVVSLTTGFTADAVGEVVSHNHLPLEPSCWGGRQPSCWGGRQHKDYKNDQLPTAYLWRASREPPALHRSFCSR